MCNVNATEQHDGYQTNTNANAAAQKHAIYKHIPTRQLCNIMPLDTLACYRYGVFGSVQVVHSLAALRS